MRDIRNSRKVKELCEGLNGRAFHRMIESMFRILRQMFEPGRSKHADKLSNKGKPLLNKIYSFRTLELYQAVCGSFLIWAFLQYGCTNINKAREFVPAYLETRISQGLSAWTIHVDASAIAKLFQCSYLEFGIILPKRLRGNVIKNIIDFEKLTYFENKYPLLAEFCKSCGLRRKELLNLRVNDIYLDDQNRVIVHVRQGKGGKKRDVVALDNVPLKLREMALAKGQDRVFLQIPTDVPTHVWRKMFAKTVYDQIARPIEELKRKQCYICRGDMKGEIYDKMAMGITSKMLGHSRLGVVTVYLKPVITKEDKELMILDAA